VKEQGLFDRLVGSFRQRLSSLPDNRTGKNTRYGMEDAALSAFSVFFTQTPSFLAYQRKMADSKGKSNAQSLFGVHQIPSDNPIRNMLNGVAPEQMFPVFEEILPMLDEQGQLDRFRSVSVRHAVSGDGWYRILQFDSNLLSAVLDPHLEVRGHPLLPQRGHPCHRLSGAEPGDSVSA